MLHAKLVKSWMLLRVEHISSVLCLRKKMLEFFETNGHCKFFFWKVSKMVWFVSDIFAWIFHFRVCDHDKMCSEIQAIDSVRICKIREAFREWNKKDCVVIGFYIKKRDKNRTYCRHEGWDQIFIYLLYDRKCYFKIKNAHLILTKYSSVSNFNKNI